MFSEVFVCPQWGSLSGESLSRQVSVWCGLCRGGLFRGGSLSGRVRVSVRASRSYTRANSAKFASTLLHCRSPSIKFPKNLLYRAPVLAPPPLYRPPQPPWTYSNLFNLDLTSHGPSPASYQHVQTYSSLYRPPPPP